MITDFAYSGIHEKRLLKYLFDPNQPAAHNPMERPIANDSQTLNVSVKFFLNQVMDVVSQLFVRFIRKYYALLNNLSHAYVRPIIEAVRAPQGVV